MHRFALALLPTLAMAAQPALMPWPSHYAAGAGELPLARFDIETKGMDPLVASAAQRLLARLGRETGMPFPAAGQAHPVRLIVRYGKLSEEVGRYGEDESYQLSLRPLEATLTAPTSLGVLRGFATIAQLATRSGDAWVLPAVEIEDAPRFGWRGLMIDSSRHFMPIGMILRNLDGMAAVKLNVLHWHLSDNQGFRVESKRYPKLHELGSDGLYYTRAQIRETIAYAHDRGIRVVPEFDMPGHSTSWLVGYPELAAGPGPFTIGRTWGIFDPALDPTRDEVYTFLDNFIGEMAALFPDAYFHIGGDEVNGRQWNTNTNIAAFKREHSLASNERLQGYFNSRVEPLVRKHGKKTMGWDEILAPELPKNIVIQSWRGPKSLAVAVKQGFQGILSSGYYLDLAQPASQHYLVDPQIDPAVAEPLILGGEACMWTEYVNADTVDSRIWPRAAAIAERLWSPANLRDVDAMYARLEPVSRKLDFDGLTHNSGYAPQLERLAPGADLRTLADVVEPVKGYARSSSGTKYTQQTPLNRLVDAARPESDKARHFAQAVSRKQWPTVRAKLETWKAYQAPATPLLEEAAPVAKNLSAMAAIGLEALAYRERGQTPPDAWAKAKLAELMAMKKPHAELLLSPVDAVAQLLR